MYTVRVSEDFSAAHAVHGSHGKCEELHGHNYRVEVAVSSPELRRPGMVVDFVELRAKLRSTLPDHRHLNELFDFNPTAERLARHFFEELSKTYPVSEVTVWETDRSRATYRPD